MNYQDPTRPRDGTAETERTRARRQPAVGVGADPSDMLLAGADEGGASLIGETLAVVRRRARILVVWSLVCLAAAALYLIMARPEFVASAQVVLEPRQEIRLGAEAAAAAAPTLDSAQAESQIQVIKSGRNLRYVFDTRNLVASPAYADSGPGPIRALLQAVVELIPGVSSLLKPDESTLEAQARVARERAFQAFIDTVSVRRLGQSYVMEVAVRAWSPGEAASLANSVTMAYIRDQVMVRAASEQRRSDFLQNRIKIIQTEKLVASESVAKGIIPDAEFPDADARVVSAALEPITKSYPQTKLILLLALAFSAVTGIGAVSIQQNLDRTIRSAQQVRRTLGIDCLGVFPRVSDQRGRYKLSYRTILDRPSSDFAGTLRNLRTALFATGDSRRGLAIGIVSWGPSEGRTTIAANLAHLRALSRDRVLLIDADLRNPAMSRQFAPTAERGLNDLILGHDADTKLPEIAIAPNFGFVPAARAGDTGDPNTFLGSQGVQNALDRLDADRDVILDLPPLSLSADAQAIGPLLTGVVLVAALNRTNLDQLAEAIRSLTAGNVRLLGVVLNDLEPNQKALRWWPFRRKVKQVATVNEAV